VPTATATAKDAGVCRSPRYDRKMDLLSTAEAAAAPDLRDRANIDNRYKWNLNDIFSGWEEWQRAYETLDTKIAAYAALQGTLAQGADRLLTAMQLSDDIGQLTYKVWYFAGLKYDEDQRDNAINAKRQQVQILFAKASQASAWFNPELLAIPLPTVQQWMSADPGLAMYRFALEDLYRQQEHVLDEKGEQLLSLDRRCQAPDDQAVDRPGDHAHLRAVSRDPGDQPQSERPRGVVRGVPQRVRRPREHLRVAL